MQSVGLELEFDGSKNCELKGNVLTKPLHVTLDFSKGGSPQKTVLTMKNNKCADKFTIGGETFGLVVVVSCEFLHLLGPSDTPLLIDQDSYTYSTQRNGIIGFRSVTIDSKMATDLYSELNPIN
jgi:hypothetical protein